MSSTRRHLAGFLRTCLKRAWANVQVRGICDREMLLLAMQESLGQLTRAHLEYAYEDIGPADRGGRRDVARELVELGALVIEFAFVFIFEEYDA